MMTVQEYLDNGGKLTPIPQLPGVVGCGWCIGCNVDGRMLPAYPCVYDSRHQCLQAINELMKQYVPGAAR